MSVVDATLRDIAEIRRRAPDLADSALAAGALVLAAGLDDDNSLTSKAQAMKVFADAMSQLQALAAANTFIA